MSEEKLEKSAEQGVAASGGIGGVSDPASGILGNVPTAEYGLTTGPNAVNPTGADGGILAAEQGRRFIDYIWDATVLAKEGRNITMRANTIELEKVNVGERVIRAANQADGTYTNTGATFTKITLTTSKIRLDWEVSAEALEDNIEGSALEDHLVRLMTSAFGNDLEDLAINGDGSTGDFLSILDGFTNQVTSGSTAHEAIVYVTNNEWTPEVLQGVISALPRKYRALKSGLKFYAGTDTFAGIVSSNGTLADSVYTDVSRERYLQGNDQVIGGARQTRALGIPVMEVPYFADDHVELTFPQNRVWGFQRDVEVYREFKPKKDTIEYTVYVRFGLAWEELDAVAYADAEGDTG
jgi:HK97 family phage major capsid protein